MKLTFSLGVYLVTIKFIISFQLLWIIIFLSFSKVSLAGKCREENLCCDGRDSGCVIQKTKLNLIKTNIINHNHMIDDNKPCYCDNACLKLGDCCIDFKDYCAVQDCQVSNWSSWSNCNINCGIGTMFRIRTILRNATNGGKHCPSMVQKRGCQGHRCHKNRNILKEIAQILPATVSKIHHKRSHRNSSQFVNNLNNIRNEDTFKVQEYCVHYKIIRATKACHKLLPPNKIHKDDRISVRCDYDAFIQDTNLIQGHKNNNKNNDKINVKNSLFYHLNDDFNGETTTKIKTDMKYRCRGEGYKGHLTKWYALAVPSCHGKWLRLTANGKIEDCTLDTTQFIFV